MAKANLTPSAGAQITSTPEAAQRERDIEICVDLFKKLSRKTRHQLLVRIKNRVELERSKISEGGKS
jgi:hypothetical protein